MLALLAGSASLVSAGATAAVRQVHGWQAAGCWQDNKFGGHALPNALSANSTVESCLSACGAAGFPVCGIEYKGECYGGLTFDGRNPALDSSRCNLACKNDASAICGGSNAMTVYITPAAYKNSPNEAFASYAGYEYQSCWSDLVGNVRALKNSVANPAGTVTGCLDACKAKNATYCALSYYGECRWDTSLSSGAVLSEDKCEYACKGAPLQSCGGNAALSLWKSAPARNATIVQQQWRPRLYLSSTPGSSFFSLY
ncbi:hypothetical protein JCM11641_007526 [Rhodosporidiobolus odoratus]